jgi:hypothetical protein
LWRLLCSGEQDGQTEAHGEQGEAVVGH